MKMIRKKDFVGFTILMMEFLVIEVYSATRLWNTGWYTIGYIGGLVMAFVGLHRYITTLNEACWGDDKTSNNGFIVCLLGYITLSIYCVYWAFKQEQRMCEKGKEYGLNLQGNDKKAAVLMLMYWGVYFASGLMSQKYVWGGIADTYSLMADRTILFMHVADIIIAIILANYLTKDLNSIITAHNKKIWEKQQSEVQES